MGPDCLTIAYHFHMSGFQGVRDDCWKLDGPFVERSSTKSEYCWCHNDVRGDSESFTSFDDGDVGCALVVDLFRLAGLLITINIVIVIKYPCFDKVR